MPPDVPQGRIENAQADAGATVAKSLNSGMSLNNRPTSLTFRSFFFAALTALSVGTASAHSVWIETLGEKLVVRFGEVGEKNEKSPGYLDSLDLPAAVVAPQLSEQKGEKLVAEKQSDLFLLKEAKTTQPAVISTTFPVMEKPATEKKPASARWPQFYARWYVAGTKAVPVSTLDIIPSEGGGKATVFYKGKPLPDAELTLIKSGGKEVDLKADSEGVVKFTAEGPGLFVLSVAGHSEIVTGTHQDKTYTVISHNSSVSWNQ